MLNTWRLYSSLRAEEVVMNIKLIAVVCVTAVLTSVVMVTVVLRHLY
jgi:hypothetical protein